MGGNPSAEDGEEALDDTAQTVIDVVHSFRLNETSFDKKSYLTYLKGALRPPPPPLPLSLSRTLLDLSRRGRGLARTAACDADGTQGT